MQYYSFAEKEAERCKNLRKTKRIEVEFFQCTEVERSSVLGEFRVEKYTPRTKEGSETDGRLHGRGARGGGRRRADTEAGCEFASVCRKGETTQGALGVQRVRVNAA